MMVSLYIEKSSKNNRLFKVSIIIKWFDPPIHWTVLTKRFETKVSLVCVFVLAKSSSDSQAFF